MAYGNEVKWFEWKPSEKVWGKTEFEKLTAVQFLNVLTCNKGIPANCIKVAGMYADVIYYLHHEEITDTKTE